MEQYNFDQPIKTSIIYERQITNPEENYSITRNLQKTVPNFSQAEHQEHLCKRQGSMDNAHLRPYERLYGSETLTQKHSFNSSCKYVLPNNSRDTYPYSRNINGNRNNFNNNSNIRNVLSYKSQMNETILVNRVAENLASIMEAYVHFFNVSNTSSCKQYIAQIRSQCLLRKLHCFQRCLVCEELLLRHENDVHFVKNLMYKVVEIAKVTIHYKLLSKLFRDLLDWIKFKKNQKMNTYQQNQRSNEIFAPELSLSSSKTTKIFSYGPPGNQVTLSIDPKILAQQRIESNDHQVSNATKTSVQNSTTTNLSNKQMTNTVRHDISQTNYAFMNENSEQNRQTYIQSIAMHSNSKYFAHSELSDGTHNNYNNNYYNAMYPDVNHIEPQDVTRSSISRDSGFTSPITSTLPSETTVWYKLTVIFLSHIPFYRITYFVFSITVQ